MPYELLAHTPATLKALLCELPPQYAALSEGPGQWTISEVIGHLIYCEDADWMPRLRLMLAQDTPTFEPFNRTGFEPQGQTLPQLLGEFAERRKANLAELQALNLRPAHLARQAIHPSLGPVVASQLLAAWVAHDLSHLHQLTRILAHSYREAVGPWSQFLGVLQCNGRSA